MKPCSIGWINLSQPVSQTLEHQMQVVCVGGGCLHQHQSNSHTGPFYCFPKNAYMTRYFQMITITKQDGKASSSSSSKTADKPVTPAGGKTSPRISQQELQHPG